MSDSPPRPRASRTRSNTETAQSRGKQMSKKKPQVDLFDLYIPVQAKTPNQKTALTEYSHGKHLLMTGSAGAGKTFLAMAMGIESFKKGMQTHIIVIRSAVATRSQGYLPGDLKDKMAEFEKPYYDICTKLFNCTERTLDPYKQLVGNKILQLMSTSYIRGITIDNAVVILDEFQNMTEHEIYSMLTRIGDNCRVIISGDIDQTDLREVSGFKRLIDTLESMQTFATVEFTIDDCVRSEFAKQFMINWAGTEPVIMSGNSNEDKRKKVQPQLLTETIGSNKS